MSFFAKLLHAQPASLRLFSQRHPTLLKKKRTFSSHIRKSIRDRVENHTWGRAFMPRNQEFLKKATLLCCLRNILQSPPFGNNTRRKTTREVGKGSQNCCVSLAMSGCWRGVSLSQRQQKIIFFYCFFHNHALSLAILLTSMYFTVDFTFVKLNIRLKKLK